MPDVAPSSINARYAVVLVLSCFTMRRRGLIVSNTICQAEQLIGRCHDRIHKHCRGIDTIALHLMSCIIVTKLFHSLKSKLSPWKCKLASNETGGRGEIIEAAERCQETPIDDQAVRVIPIFHERFSSDLS